MVAAASGPGFPLDDAPTDTDQAALPFWSVMAFTAVLLFSPQTYVPALAPFRPALLVILIGVLPMYRTDGHEGFQSSNGTVRSASSSAWEFWLPLPSRSPCGPEAALRCCRISPRPSLSLCC